MTSLLGRVTVRLDEFLIRNSQVAYDELEYRFGWSSRDAWYYSLGVSILAAVTTSDNTTSFYVIVGSFFFLSFVYYVVKKSAPLCFTLGRQAQILYDRKWDIFLGIRIYVVFSNSLFTVIGVLDGQGTWRLVVDAVCACLAVISVYFYVSLEDFDGEKRKKREAKKVVLGAEALPA